MRRRAAWIGGIAALALAGAMASAFAFSSQASAVQAISTVALTAPTGLVATPAGHDVSLAWSAGSGGTAYSVLAAPAAMGGSCTGVTFAALTSTAVTSATDTGRYAPQGTYECYEVKTADGGWTSLTGNPVVAARIGFVATAVQLTNGGVAGQLDAGDRIVVTFNQAVDPATGPVAGRTVCVATSGTMALASSGVGTSCSTTGDRLCGLTFASASRSARYAATYTWTASTALAILIGSRTAGLTPTVSGAGTFTPASGTGVPASQTGGFAVCSSNTGGGVCLPTATGSL
jgi:hypothetical protein